MHLSFRDWSYYTQAIIKIAGYLVQDKTKQNNKSSAPHKAVIENKILYLEIGCTRTILRTDGSELKISSAQFSRLP